ncbi:hypothetical protein [uncultured Microbulbifer sp.]|uniref:hypothetical protein n=1 Tax=uncultured Microbulbifer sp. TaxID=348147 RepID=UPI002610193E|nr:hypothetical protein [uncultured Microbulbifer sp.]
MIRYLLLASLLTSIVLTGCSRKSETHDPDHTADPAQQTETEVIEETTITETDRPDDTSAPDYADKSSTGETGSDSAAADSDNAESPNSEGQLICNATWFEWVNGKVTEEYSEAITEQYPTGLPSVGSDDWFIAMDKLTGGDGAHGPDGGSDEWCFMIQQRLGNSD